MGFNMRSSFSNLFRFWVLLHCLLLSNTTTMIFPFRASSMLRILGWCLSSWTTIPLSAMFSNSFRPFSFRGTLLGLIGFILSKSTCWNSKYWLRRALFVLNLKEGKTFIKREFERGRRWKRFPQWFIESKEVLKKLREIFVVSDSG